MPLYRVLRPLPNAPRGTISDLTHIRPDALAKLQELGMIAPVSSPPLSILKGWSVRGKKFEKEGVMTVAQFLETDSAVLARIAGRSVEVIEQWKGQLREVLTSKPGRG